mgnify:FL=1
MKKIIIGARGSKLSLAYVSYVKNLILDKSPNLNIEVKIIKTTGDNNINQKISEIGGKNMFCKEIEEDLLSDKIDLAVHSLKDMDSKEHGDLIIGAYIKRNDPRDVLISKKTINLETLGKIPLKIGSSSRRRELQLKKLNNNISIQNIRGNIDTRIKKIDEDNLDAIILASAGVKSLNLQKKISLFFNFDQILPAVGQGIIAVQCKKKSKSLIEVLNRINNKESYFCALAERAMLKAVGGDCDTAVGGLAEIDKKNLRLKAQLFSDDGKNSYNFESSGRDYDAVKIGECVGYKLLELAGSTFKKK